MIFANTTNQLRTLYFSKSSDFENFTIGTADADSLSFTLASDNANEVRYLQPGRHLQVGTSGGEFTVTSSTEGPLTPTTTQILNKALMDQQTCNQYRLVMLRFLRKELNVKCVSLY